LIQDRLKLRYLAIGSNFRCGYGLDTDSSRIASMNRDFGSETDIVPPVMVGGEPVSSSRIRTAMAAGDLVEARALSGRDIELDLVAVPTTPGPEGVDYDAGAVKRLAPPPGRYAVTYFCDDVPPFRGFADISGTRIRCPRGQIKRVRFDVDPSRGN